jgi:hypothetical protein
MGGGLYHALEKHMAAALVTGDRRNSAATALLQRCNSSVAAQQRAVAALLRLSPVPLQQRCNNRDAKRSLNTVSTCNQASHSEYL